MPSTSSQSIKLCYWPFSWLNQLQGLVEALQNIVETHILWHEVSGCHFVHSIQIFEQMFLASWGNQIFWCSLLCVPLFFFLPRHPVELFYQLHWSPLLLSELLVWKLHSDHLGLTIDPPFYLELSFPVDSNLNAQSLNNGYFLCMHAHIDSIEFGITVITCLRKINIPSACQWNIWFLQRW